MAETRFFGKTGFQFRRETNAQLLGVRFWFIRPETGFFRRKVGLRAARQFEVEDKCHNTLSSRVL